MLHLTPRNAPGVRIRVSHLIWRELTESVNEVATSFLTQEERAKQTKLHLMYARCSAFHRTHSVSRLDDAEQAAFFGRFVLLCVTFDPLLSMSKATLHLVSRTRECQVPDGTTKLLMCALVMSPCKRQDICCASQTAATLKDQSEPRGRKQSWICRSTQRCVHVSTRLQLDLHAREQASSPSQACAL